MKTDHKDIHDHLIEAAKLNQGVAQAELYRLYSKAMLNTSYRILNDVYLAEDALQNAFVKVFKNIDQYRGESTFGAWIKRIVINASLNILQKNQMVFEDIEGQDWQQEEISETVDLNVDQIKAAVGQLPDGFRTVFSLYAFEGYDHQEIGSILEISESTSKTQYNRAKVKLRNILKEMYGYER